MGCIISQYKFRKETQILFKCNNDNVSLFSFKNQEKMCKIVSVYDGDTFTACFLDKKRIIKYKFRTLGYDSPEMKPLKVKPNRDQEIIKAKEARLKFIEYSNCENDLVKIKFGSFDKYGRILGTVFNNKDGSNVNIKMIQNGYGYEYDGGTKKIF